MLKNMNLKWKIILAFTLCVFIIMLVVAFIIQDFTTDVVLDQITETINTVNDYQKNILNNILTEVKKDLDVIPEDSNIQTFTEVAYNLKKYEEFNEEDISEYDYNELMKTVSIVRNMGKRLNNFLRNISYGEVAFITIPDGTVIADSRLHNLLLITESRKYVGKKLPSEQYKEIDFEKIYYLEKKPHILINTPITSRGEIIGYCVVGLSIDIFRENLDTSLGDYGQGTLINDKGIILNHQDDRLIGKEIKNKWYIEQIQQQSNFDDNLKKQNITDDYYHMLTKMTGREIFFAINIPVDKVNAPAKELQRRILIITLIGAIIIFLIMLITLNWQFQPLNKLLEKIKKVRSGDFNVKMDVQKNDEIGIVADNFNKMLVDIKKLMNKIREDQEEIRNLELKALQSQINPHFLYNTLDSIYWMTKTREYKEIGEMTVLLSNFFRLSINKGRNITYIGKEIEHVKNYIRIQKLRYPEKFECKINVNPEIMNNECIKLILQPLVENSLLHGLEDRKEDGVIDIEGKIKGDKVILKVSDNGKGFDVEQMEYLMQSEGNIGDDGYALRNINSRLKIYYGDKFGLFFHNTEIGGACVMIKIPVKKYKGEDNVQIADC